MSISDEIFIRRHIRPDLREAEVLESHEGEEGESITVDSAIATRVAFLPRLKGCKEDKEDDKDDKGLEKNDKGTRNADGSPSGPVSDNCVRDSCYRAHSDAAVSTALAEAVHVSVFA